MGCSTAKVTVTVPPPKVKYTPSFTHISAVGDDSSKSPRWYNPTFHERYVLQLLVGTGHFGQVFVASDFQNSIEHAVKIVNLQVQPDENVHHPPSAKCRLSAGSRTMRARG
jgi:serine/threonine protein kinase